VITLELRGDLVEILYGGDDTEGDVYHPKMVDV
jgi:hypothetical protein